MKILLINKSDVSGGAAIACRRLFNSLSNYGLDTKMLVQEKKLNIRNIEGRSTNSFQKAMNFIRFAYEKIYFLKYEASKDVRFSFSVANTGEDITKKKIFKDSDIIHLHWFNQGFLSLKSLEKIIKSKKKIIWTLHDMWAFTGGCHYSGNCGNYINACGNCSFLKSNSDKDLSNKIFLKKNKIYENSNITFVTCSKWLADTAKRSRLLQNQNVVSIPNPIDINIFKPLNKSNLRLKYNLDNNKYYILFGAANISHKRKGIHHLIEALKIISNKYPKKADKIEVLLFGKSNNTLIESIPFKIHNLGYLNDSNEIVEAYNLADLFVLPSLEDNLPNTIIESLACGTPAVAFKTGGIPEIIDNNKNGYLANYMSNEDLAFGIHKVLFELDKDFLKQNSLTKVSKTYRPDIIAKKYHDLYSKRL